MTLQAIKQGLWMPGFPSGIGAALTTFNTSATIDAASEGLGVVFRAAKSKNIHKVWWRTGTVTTGGTNNIDIRVELPSAAGINSGSLWNLNGTGANPLASYDLLDADDNSWLSATLTDDAILVAGDEVVIVISNPAANFGNWAMQTMTKEGNNHAYEIRNAGSWAKASDGFPLIIPEYSDGSFEPYPGITMLGIEAATGYNSGTATNVRGNIFQVPFPCRVSGAWIHVDSSTAGSDYSVKLYDSAGSSVLATTGTIDSDYGQGGLKFFNFNATVTLSPNTNYRVVAVPETANNITVRSFTMGSAAMMDMLPLGQSCFLTTRSSAGAWTDSGTAQRQLIGVLVDQFDDGGANGPKGLTINNGRSAYIF